MSREASFMSVLVANVDWLCSAIVVGSPPAYRGGVQGPRDLELRLLKLFPNSSYFIEKVSQRSTASTCKILLTLLYTFSRSPFHAVPFTRPWS